MGLPMDMNICLLIYCFKLCIRCGAAKHATVKTFFAGGVETIFKDGQIGKDEQMKTLSVTSGLNSCRKKKLL